MKTILHFIQIKNKLSVFAADVQGATGIEYAMIGGMVTAAMVTGAAAFGSDLSTMLDGWMNVGDGLYGGEQ